jgi:hypothetical protein
MRGERRPATCLALLVEKKGKRAEGKGAGWAGLREREREVLEFSFFSNSFSNFCKLHSNNKTMHSNHDAQTLIVSNIIEMIFKYFKGQNLFDNLVRSLEN